MSRWLQRVDQRDPPQEMESIIRMVRSQLDVSLVRLLGQGDEDEDEPSSQD